MWAYVGHCQHSLSQVQIWQGRALGCQQGGASAFLQASAKWRGVLDPEKMVFVCIVGEGLHKDIGSCLSSPLPEAT